MHVPPEQALQHWLLLLQEAPGALLQPVRVLPAGQQKFVVPLHVTPQPPQFDAVLSAVHVPLQQPWPEAQSAAVQQFAVGMQAPLQSLNPVLHAKPQVPLLQTGCALATLVVQTLPQLPQFATVFSGVQTPLQQP